MYEVYIDTQYIKLGQLLKLSNIAQSGANAKEIIKKNIIKVNSEIVTQRGKKLFENDIIKIENYVDIIIKRNS